MVKKKFVSPKVHQRNSKICFVIMPISVPKHLLAIYDNDVDHFRHVFIHVFEPVLEQVGYTASFPAIKGTRVILREIIEFLKSADLVLCDISILNPNVFFELGIRTALNKPIVLVGDKELLFVEDEQTLEVREKLAEHQHIAEKLPFDLRSVGVHVYDGSLRAWKLNLEKESLKNHIESSIADSGGRSNAIWGLYSQNNSTASAGTNNRDWIINAYYRESLPMSIDEIANELVLDRRYIDDVVSGISEKESKEKYGLSKYELVRRRNKNDV